MTKENERLDTLLRDKKITQDEYKLLSKALVKKTGLKLFFSLES